MNQDIAPLLLSYFANCLLRFSCLNPYVQVSDSNLKRIGPTTHCLRLVQLVWGWESLPSLLNMNRHSKIVFFSPRGFHSAGKIGDPPINHRWRCDFFEISPFQNRDQIQHASVSKKLVERHPFSQKFPSKKKKQPKETPRFTIESTDGKPCCLGCLYIFRPSKFAIFCWAWIIKHRFDPSGFWWFIPRVIYPPVI